NGSNRKQSMLQSGRQEFVTHNYCTLYQSVSRYRPIRTRLGLTGRKIIIRRRRWPAESVDCPCDFVATKLDTNECLRYLQSRWFLWIRLHASKGCMSVTSLISCLAVHRKCIGNGFFPARNFFCCFCVGIKD